MKTASILLVVIGLLGAFDIAYFHWYTCRLSRRAESRVEVWLHVARGFIYALQFALVPNVRFHGAWYLAFAALFVADVAVAWADVAVEPASRRSLELQGGPMDPSDVVRYERLPFGQQAARLRRWDDRAKVPGLPTPDLAHYRQNLSQVVLIRRPGGADESAWARR